MEEELEGVHLGGTDRWLFANERGVSLRCRAELSVLRALQVVSLPSSSARD